MRKWMLPFLAVSVVSCGTPDQPANNEPANNENSTENSSTGKGDTAEDVFAKESLYLTGAFDGSKRFGMWVDTMEFTRRIERETGKRIRWTYFINTCYYDHTVDGSWIGTSGSREESIVRTALTQQAINEGHEIGNHAVRHQDGSEWSKEQWREEIQEFHDVTDASLFNPIYDSLTGEQVFPKWPDGSDVEEGAVGSICESGSDCDSGICLPVTADTSYCSQRCNGNNPCPEGSACGAPDWNTSTDRCIPMPEFPVEYQGEELFDAEGNANLNHPALETYEITGFRAPQLGHNTALFEVLDEFGYEYDTSKVLGVGPPQRVRHRGETFENLYEFALMKNPGSATIPMDYNYKFGDYSGERMLSDYRTSVLDAYEARGRQPWNIGHHFALWKRGAYWAAMQDVFEWAANGCPNDSGVERCPETEFPTFKELSAIIDAINEDKSDDTSGEAGDIFADVDNPEEDHESGDCMCGEGEETPE
jgi:peptidoglycan/xylan/chitin deacetylase (PgdA/CDA1 family)